MDIEYENFYTCPYCNTDVSEKTILDHMRGQHGVNVATTEHLVDRFKYIGGMTITKVKKIDEP